MKLRTQFIITMFLFGIILVMIAASAIMTHLELEKTNEQESFAWNIAQGASELSYLANDYLIYRESQQLKRWQSKFASFSGQVGSLNVDKPEQQVLVRNIQANQKRLKEVFDSVVSALGNLSPNQRVAIDPVFLQVSWSRMAVQSQGLVSDASRLVQLLDRQMEQLIDTRATLLYFMVGLFGLYLLASYMLTYRRILKSLAKLQAGAAVIGAGNLDFKFEEKKNDEIGELSHAFNLMSANLREITASKSQLEREIAGRKKAEEELLKTHERAIWLARFPEQNPNPIIRVSADGTVLYCNPSSIKLHGWNCEVGQPLPNELLPLVGQAIAEGKYMEQDIQLGERFHIVSVTPFPEERYANIYGRDITERKEAEKSLRLRSIELQQLTESLEQRVRERTEELAEANRALRQLSIRLLSAHEEERKRIAGEIHDSLGACFSAIKFKVEDYLQVIEETGKVATPSLKTIIPLIQEGVEECRRIQMDLRPPMLDDLGLLATLSWFCRRFQTIYSGIHVEQEMGIEESEIPTSLKTVIYRLTQEAMSNIAKHSKANLVRLSMTKIESEMKFIIEDNGQGFNLGKVLGAGNIRRGLGLTSMRERTELSGGSFNIKSAEGKGTTIRASWPL